MALRIKINSSTKSIKALSVLAPPVPFRFVLHILPLTLLWPHWLYKPSYLPCFYPSATETLPMFIEGDPHGVNLSHSSPFWSQFNQQFLQCHHTALPGDDIHMLWSMRMTLPAAVKYTAWKKSLFLLTLPFSGNVSLSSITRLQNYVSFLLTTYHSCNFLYLVNI